MSKALSSMSLKETYILLVSRYSNIPILLNSISLRKILLIVSRRNIVINKGRGTFK
jgi:hypothetical protein